MSIGNAPPWAAEAIFEMVRTLALLSMEEGPIAELAAETLGRARTSCAMARVIDEATEIARITVDAEYLASCEESFGRCDGPGGFCSHACDGMPF